MLIGILRNLANFSLRRPRTLAAIVVGVGALAFGAHYFLLKSERDRLELERDAYQEAVDEFQRTNAILQEDIELARRAANEVIAERDAARRALDEFRAGRENDPESQEWAAEPIPAGERERLCTALPKMEGCDA